MSARVWLCLVLFFLFSYALATNQHSIMGIKYSLWCTMERTFAKRRSFQFLWFLYTHTHYTYTFIRDRISRCYEFACISIKLNIFFHTRSLLNIEEQVFNCEHLEIVICTQIRFDAAHNGISDPNTNDWRKWPCEINFSLKITAKLWTTGWMSLRWNSKAPCNH